MPLAATKKTNPAFTEAATEPANDAGQHEVIAFPSGQVVTTPNENIKLLADNPELVDQAKTIGPNGLNPIATIQFIKQSLMLADNLAKAQTSEEDKSWVRRQNQTVFKPSEKHIVQAQKTDGGGVDAIWSSAFLHLKR